MKYYSGVGSRSTPQNIQLLMTKLAFKLAQKGYILRSGGAGGADDAFERGVIDYAEQYDSRDTLAQIYVPWAGFVEYDEMFKDWYKVLDRLPNKDKAQEIASKVHPAWDKCSRGAKALHTRNVYQVLGDSLNTPSQFLICWAEPDKHGVPKGGTRTAWVLGEEYIGKEKCFNLYFEEHRKRVEKFLEVE